MRTISKVAVLGSGVMGGAIAAHLANCGIPSVMLDIVPFDLADADKGNKKKRNNIAAASKKPTPSWRIFSALWSKSGSFIDRRSTRG